MNNDSVEKMLNKVKSTMDYENLPLSDEDIERCRKVATGEITGDEAIKEALKRFTKA